jgi:hypothetical protein
MSLSLRAKKVPYSSVVGGSLTLHDNQDRARFMVLFAGTTEGITKEETAALQQRIADLIETHGLEVPERA